MRNNQINAFIDLVRENKRPNMVTCEIGCNYGDTSLCYIPMVKDLQGLAYLIDTFEGTKPSKYELDTHNAHFYNEYNVQNMYKELFGNISKLDLLDYVKILKGDSQLIIIYYQR